MPSPRSVVGLKISAEAMVANAPKQGPPAALDHGGMGGMDFQMQFPCDRRRSRIRKLDASTRFLSALRQILSYPLLCNVGLPSPDLRSDIVRGESRLLPTYAGQLQAPIGCANLCGSLASAGDRALPADTWQRDRPLAADAVDG